MTDIVSSKAARSFFLNGATVSINDFMLGAGQVLVSVRENEDWQLLGNTMKSLVGLTQAGGKALACLAHGGLSIWKEKGHEEKDYFTVMDVHSSVSRQTLESYVQAWEGLLTAPPELQEQLLEQPLKNLKYIGSAVAQGYVPDEVGWHKLVEAQSFDEFVSVMHEETDLPSRKNRISVELWEDGSLYVWSNDNREFVGYLEVNSASDAVKKAIKRLTSGRVKEKK